MASRKKAKPRKSATARPRPKQVRKQRSRKTKRRASATPDRTHRPVESGGSIISSLNRAFDDASRRAIKDVLALVPGSTALGKFLDQLASSPYIEHLRRLTLDEFAEAIRSVPARIVASARPSGRDRAVGGKRRSYDTRTSRGRQRLEADVEGALRALGDASATQLRKAVGGTPAQIRTALERLAERKLLVRKGQRRATRYVWKG